jgi:hypothetical protein
VAVPVGHRLVAAARIAVHELAGEPWVIGDGTAGDPQFRVWPTNEVRAMVGALQAAGRGIRAG